MDAYQHVMVYRAGDGTRYLYDHSNYTDAAATAREHSRRDDVAGTEVLDAETGAVLMTFIDGHAVTLTSVDTGSDWV